MSFPLYKAEMAQDKVWQAKYLESATPDTGVTSPQGYNIFADPRTMDMRQQTLTASQQGMVPDSTNPAGTLYASGANNMFLLSSSSAQCDTGCLLNAKPNPTLSSIKSLYKASVPSGPVYGPYMNLGMY